MLKPIVWIAVVLVPAVAGLACDSGQLGTGVDAGGAGGAGGSSMNGALVECADRSALGVLVPAAYANPADFSVPAGTATVDQHTLVILRRDVFDSVTAYVTGGPADHQHAIVLTLAQVSGIQANTPFTVTTEAAQGRGPLHTHELMVHTCGIPGD